MIRRFQEEKQRNGYLKCQMIGLGVFESCDQVYK